MSAERKNIPDDFIARAISELKLKERTRSQDASICLLRKSTTARALPTLMDFAIEEIQRAATDKDKGTNLINNSYRKPDVIYAIDWIGRNHPQAYVNASIKLINSSDPVISTVGLSLNESVREGLAPEATKGFDKALNRISRKEPGTTDACSALCQIANKFEQWAKPSFFSKDENIQDPQFAWRFATESLALLFIAKSSPYCSRSKLIIDQLTVEWFDKLSISKKDTPEIALFEGMSKLPPRAVSKPIEFQLRAMRAISKEGRAHNSPIVYGGQFYSLLLREISRRSDLDANQRKQITTAIDSTEDLLGKMTAQYKDSTRENRDSLVRAVGGNSIFSTYAVATSVLANDKVSKDTLSRLKEMLAETGDPLNVPYWPVKEKVDPPHFKSDREREKKRNVHRSSAGRAVPFNLALYRFETDPKKKREYRNNLIMALNNFVEYGNTLLQHSTRDGTHYGVDGLAPYYYYSNLPYATAAVRLLLDEKKNRDESLGKIKSELLDLTLRSFKPDGLFLKGGEQSYPSQPVYTNPLGGLALLPLIDACSDSSGVRKRVPTSLGILDREINRVATEGRHRSWMEKMLILASPLLSHF